MLGNQFLALVDCVCVFVLLDSAFSWNPLCVEPLAHIGITKFKFTGFVWTFTNTRLYI